MVEVHYDESPSAKASKKKEPKEQKEHTESPTSRLSNRADREWKPSWAVTIPTGSNVILRKSTRPASNTVKIFLPNIGLKASAVAAATASGMQVGKTHVSKKINVAISSSDEDWSCFLYLSLSYVISIENQM